MLMDLELRHLRAVRAIADAGSLTRAALVLGVSQPALTAQLRRIEREIGGRLFERGRHGAVPTPLGDFVITRAKAVLLGVEELRRGPVRERDGPPVVWVGGIAAAVSIGLADRLSDHLRDVQVQVRAEYSPRLLWDLIREDRLDAVAIVDYPGYELQVVPGLSRELVAVEPVFLALWAGHPLAGNDEIELADLADQVWVLTPPDGAGWPDCFYSACRRAGFAPRTLHQISDALPVKEMVATRRAVSPCQAVFAAGDGVVVRPLAGTPIEMRHLLVWRDNGPLAGYADVLLRFARDAYRAHVLRAPHYLDWLRRHGHRDFAVRSITPVAGNLG